MPNIASYLSMAVTKEQISPWKAPSPKAVLLGNFQGAGKELTELHASECNRLEKLECMQEPPEAIVRNVKEHICYLEDSIHNLEER